MAVERTETAIIGGGQAGLAMSHCLTQRGLPHVVLERRRIAERWRTERWDSLRFQFPNWSMRLPGFAYAGNDPDGFAPRDDVVRFIGAYARFIRAPVRTGVEVRSLRRGLDGFRLETGGFDDPRAELGGCDRPKSTTRDSGSGAWHWHGFSGFPQ